MQGLQKFPAFNGLRGTVQLLDETTGRRVLGPHGAELRGRRGGARCQLSRVPGYNVQLSSSQIAKIKGDNLRMRLGFKVFMFRMQKICAQLEVGATASSFRPLRGTSEALDANPLSASCICRHLAYVCIRGCSEAEESSVTAADSEHRGTL